MSSQGFSFPPPPPPPPSTTQQPSAYPSAHSGQHWNARGSSGRGRGRGHGNRGRGGGAQHYSSDNNRPQYSNPPGYNYAAGNYGYPAQPQPVSTTSYMPPTPTPPPPYPHSQANFQHPQTPPTYQSPQSYPQPAGSAAYPRIPGYNNGPTANMTHSAPYPTQATPTYPPNVPPVQHGPSSNNPMMMGAPWGGPPAPHGRGGWSSHAHGNHASKPRHHNNNKRDHTSAFSKPQSSVPRTPAPPAVPSFGNPLPSKPPPAADVTRKPAKKRKRKHNQLGLTPKTDDHESSEEEEDVDEEIKLAQTSSDAAAPLQFTYRGQTATLQSQSDIAAWIAERKKKFPTQARIDEKKKAAEEAKTARDAARLEKQKERGKEKEKHKAKQQASPQRSTGDAAAKSDPVLDAALKAQRKAEKIRRNLAKAEAEAEAARLKVEALQRQAQGLKDKESSQARDDVPTTDLPAVPSAGAGTGGAATGLEVPKAPESSSGKTSTSVPVPVSASVPTAAINVAANLVDPNSDLDSDGLDMSDWTSSSGSGADSDLDSGSNADSDSDSDDDNDSAPEEVSSRRQGPERVPAPPREGKKAACRHFARTGRCNRGDRCKFSHEVSEKGPKAKPAEKEKKGRKGLLQALLDRQKDDEDRRAMEVISWLGQNGHLAVPATSNEASASTTTTNANVDANFSANVDDTANAGVDAGADVEAGVLANTAPQSDTPA